MPAIVYLVILLFSISLHEAAHGYFAYKMGDPTAKGEGRISLNPLRHLDFYGSFLLPAFTLILTLGKGPILGWAKPVPINPYNFKNPKWDNAKVALAGPFSNITLAVLTGILLRFLSMPVFLFNLFSLVFFTNFSLALFNLLPIPPLDGSHFLFAILPEQAFGLKRFLFRWGSVMAIFFLFFFGLNFIGYLTGYFYQLIVGLRIVF